MKVVFLFSVLVVLALLSSTCDASRKRVKFIRNPIKVYKPQDVKVDVTNDVAEYDEKEPEEVDDARKRVKFTRNPIKVYKPQDVKVDATNDVAEYDEKEPEEVDDMLMVEDMDEDDEMNSIEEALDISSEVFGIGKGDLKSKQFRNSIRKTGRKDARDYKKLMRPSSRCENVDEQVDAICKKVNAALDKKSLQRLYLSRFQSSGQKADWLECCELEDTEERSECVSEIKMARLETLCSMSTKSKKRVNKCCEVEDQERLDCFNRINNRMCKVPRYPKEPNGNGTEIITPKPEKCDTSKYRNWVSRDKYPGEPIAMARGRPFSDRRKGRRAEAKANKMCCKAGQFSRGDNQTIASCQECEDNFKYWAESQEGMTSMCPSKFIWCCANLRTVPPMPSENATSSNESTPVPKSPRITDRRCCALGKRRSNNAGGLGAKLECYRGQQELERSNPEYGVKCFSKYFDCCMKPRRISPKVTDVSPKKIPTAWDRKGEELPDGLRKTADGHYYYVDFAAPGFDDVKRRTVKMPK